MDGPYHNKALPSGTVLREWRLEQVLGVGGFGIVYRGRGIYFDELVAIKEYFPGAISDRLDGTTVVPTDSSSEDTYLLGLHKFVEEAKVLWNLSKPERHPNIVSVRSLFEIHGTAYMVMDFESGVSLSQMLKDGKKFGEKRLLDLIRPIANGLDRAHKAGVLHRDIKPANILVADDGRPVLIDFGSARFESGQATSTKVTFYTPPYAAIEQYVKTYPQGPWTDIYAMGVVLYQCATGEKPPEVLERLHGGLGEAMSAREWPGFSKTFTRAVDAAMAIRPSERPQSIPEWLRMFEPESVAHDDEVTRVTVATVPASVLSALAASEPAPAAAMPETHAAHAAAQDHGAHAAASYESHAEAPAEHATHYVASPAPADAAVVDPKAPLHTRVPPTLILAAAAAALAMVLAAYLIMPAHRGTPQVAHTAPAKPVAVAAVKHKPVPAAAASITVPSISAAFDELIAKAQEAGRPAKEMQALTDARAQLVPLTDQIRALGAKPGNAEKEKPMVDQLNAGAHDMATREGEALTHAIKRHWKDVEEPGNAGLTGEAATAIAAVRSAKEKLEQSVTAAGNAATAADAVDATRDAVIAYGDFETNYAKVGQYLIPAKKNAFATLDTTARSLSERVVALAGSTQKPWLFASRARKDAYQLLQDNAARAREDAATLDSLSRSAASSDIKQIEASIAQATTIKQSLNRLLVSSNSAAAQLAQ